MAIGHIPGTPVGPVTLSQSEIDVVYSQDPDVVMNRDPEAWGVDADADMDRVVCVGWIDVKDPRVVSAGPGATTVRVRAMNARELAKGLDLGGEAQARLNALACCVMQIGKTRKTHDIETWINTLYTGADTHIVADLLALLCIRRTKRIPLDELYDIARDALAPKAKPEVVTDGGATKSE